MKIGLLIAIERELKSFLEYGSKLEEITIRNRTVYKTVIKNHEVYAIKSGYGLIDSASATELLICMFDVELVLNFGVTGALVRGIDVSDMFVVNSCVGYGFDVSPIDPVKKAQYGEFEDIYIPFTKSKIDLVHEILPDVLDAVAASGDRFISEKEDKDYLASLGCNICDMESVAIARVCYLCNTECLSLKCISDNYDGNGGDFIANVERSAKIAFNVLLKLFDRL